MAEFAGDRRLAVTADALGRARELFDAARIDEDEVAATMAPPSAQRPACCSTRTARSASPPAAAAARTRGSRWSASRPPIPPSSPTRSPPRPAPARRCRPASPASTSVPERFDVLPNDLAAVRRRIEQLAQEAA